ncbi:MAG: dihydroxyacetone kinase subunit DhaK [Actinomycetaceae bacterium]|nr:dihydroxyacetone kinase subunit DhaK [Actinomycetaceae bacterium]MDY6082661.1 dihydroxyacetone kinase subunit DhaK [Actinomycetaceae bacterium]
MKKLINAPEDVIKDALIGIEAADPRVLVDHEERVIYRKEKVDGKVGIVSGGGSGHEPLHGGYVGKGMLDAAAAGEMFTSPTPDQVLFATQQANTGAGVLHIVKNYTGDVMNFDMAAEMAADEDIRVETVIVADDVAVEDSTFTAGRRGVGLTVLVEKIAGAAAEAGQSLDDVKAVAEKVCKNGRSMGIALTSCTVPAVGHPTFDLPDDEIEIGIGIHGEPGRERIKLEDAHHLAQRIVTPILEDFDFEGSRVIAMLNGMGATPLAELYLMYGEVKQLLDAESISVERAMVGNYITSLDMAGCSLTLLKVDDDLLRLFDAPVNTSGLRWGE